MTIITLVVWSFGPIGPIMDSVVILNISLECLMLPQSVLIWQNTAQFLWLTQVKKLDVFSLEMKRSCMDKLILPVHLCLNLNRTILLN